MLKLITIPKPQIFTTRAFQNPNHIIFHSKPISATPQNSPSTPSIPPPTHQHLTQLILDQKSPSQAIQTFQWASKLPNFTHSQSTYRALIHKLCTFRRFDTARQLLDEMPDSIGCPPDESLFVTLVRGFGRARMIRDAIKVVELVAKFGVRPSLKIYNSILDVLVREDIDLAREFYRKKMMENGVCGDDYTFGILMKGLCLTNRIGDGFKLLQVMRSGGIRPNTVIYNTLLHGLCRNGKVGRARSLMNEMEDPNDVSFNILISAYCNEENLVQALVLLQKSFSFGFVPDVVTVTKVLELLCSAGRVDEALETLERVESKGGVLDVVAYNTLMKGFCRLGKLKVGCRLLKEMEKKGSLPNADTYNILISGFCEAGLLDSAISMFNDMKTDGITWNFLTFDTLIQGLCLEGRTGDAFKILEQMEESKGGSRGQISPYNSILYGLYKENRMDEAFEFLVQLEKLFPRAVDRSLTILGSCSDGGIEDAYRVYQQMIVEGGTPNVLIYDCLIYGFCQQGCTREAFELLNDMIGHGYFPVASIFNALIAEFCRQGKVGSAAKLLEDVEVRGCKSNVDSYSSLIDACCSNGDCQKARTLFLQMVDRGIRPDHSVWNSLVLCQSQEKNWSNSKNLLVITDILGSAVNT